MSDLTSLVNILRAAGETTRMRLLALLAHGELSVKDLTEILDQSQPRVSRHLKLLADAGLVVRHAEGAWAYYGLAENGEGAAFTNWITDRLSATNGQLAADLLKLIKLREFQQFQAAQYFSSVAQSWDALRSLHVPESAVEAAILEVIGERRFELLVDLGTGTGRMLELLRDHYTRGIGIDYSREMIAVARAKLLAAHIAHAQVRLGDISDLPEGADKADFVVLHQVLHYFDDPGKILLQAGRQLCPAGEALIVDFAPHGLEFLRNEHAHRRLGLSEAQMEVWARAAGLSVVQCRYFPNHASEEGLTVCLWLLRKEN